MPFTRKTFLASLPYGVSQSAAATRTTLNSVNGARMVSTAGSMCKVSLCGTPKDAPSVGASCKRISISESVRKKRSARANASSANLSTVFPE